MIQNVQSIRHRKTGCFANPDVLVRGWYVVASTRRLKRGKAMGIELADRRLAVWRDHRGNAHAIDARCAHLGADLAQGQVSEDGALRCGFHGWSYNSHGKCIAIPSCLDEPVAKLQSYIVTERYGLVWVYVGGESDFALPDMPGKSDEQHYRFIKLPAQRLACHTHLVIGNGLDAQHFSELHEMEHTAEPVLTEPEPHRVALKLKGRPNSALRRFATGTTSKDIDVTFQTVGPSIAWASLCSPIDFHVLFTGRPLANGDCATQVVMCMPRSSLLASGRAVLLLLTLLHSDKRILESLAFQANFTHADEPLSRFAKVIEELGAL